ncbi:MAG: hypothetical protein K6A23_13270 [Butyrivibrio sp.]|nr:hypothetical protein [Butyrivibrio sp.]
MPKISKEEMNNTKIGSVVNQLREKQKEILDRKVKTTAMTDYLHTEKDKLNEIINGIKDNKKAGHIDSKEYYEPLMSAAKKISAMTSDDYKRTESATAEYNKVMADLQNMKDACDKYIKKNSWGIFNRIFKSTEGNNRLNYVKRLKSKINEMIEKYEKAYELDRYSELVNDLATVDITKESPASVSDKISEIRHQRDIIINSPNNVFKSTFVDDPAYFDSFIDIMSMGTIKNDNLTFEQGKETDTFETMINKEMEKNKSSVKNGVVENKSMEEIQKDLKIKNKIVENKSFADKRKDLKTFGKVSGSMGKVVGVNSKNKVQVVSHYAVNNSL